MFNWSAYFVESTVAQRYAEMSPAPRIYDNGFLPRSRRLRDLLRRGARPVAVDEAVAVPEPHVPKPRSGERELVRR
jgi:hypothetical protein